MNEIVAVLSPPEDLGTLTTFDDILKGLEDRQRKEHERVMSFEPLYPIAAEYAMMFSANHRRSYEEDAPRSSQINAALGIGTVNALYLDLHMSKQDSMALDVKPIFDGMDSDPRLSFFAKSGYLEMGWIGKKYILASTPEAKRTHYKTGVLLVRAWFERSQDCKVIGTGKYTEDKKIVCKDEKDLVL